MTYVAGSNRLAATLGGSGTPLFGYTYDLDGNRVEDLPQVAAPAGYRAFFFNAVGQLMGDTAYWGYGAYQDSFPAPSYQWIGSRSHCRYDPVGRRTWACGNSGGKLGYDGDNVIRGMGAWPTPIWRYVHGPGLDDPLVAVQQVGAGMYERYYYLTDGGGRHLAFTNALGGDWMTGPDRVWDDDGGNQAGSTNDSYGFQHERGETGKAPQLSFYRNRYYDQQTARFLTEDPIGPAGGLNLYVYAGNNPATFTDPFGLMADSTKKEPEVVKTSVKLGPGGSSLTVTNEYAPLTQEQADYIHDDIAYQEDVGGVAAGIVMALATKALGTGKQIMAGAGAGLAVAGTHAYTPRTGDQITTTVTAAYGSGAATQTFVVRRSDGSTLRYNFLPWGLR